MTNDEIVQKVRAATDGLLFMSESDYPFEVFQWSETATITPDFLKSLSGLPADTPVETRTVDDLFKAAVKEYEGQSEQGRSTAARFRNLVTLIKDNLTEPVVYRLGTINIAVYIVGKTSSGEWIGLSTRVVET
jgi:hypothetical protein